MAHHKKKESVGVLRKGRGIESRGERGREEG